MNHCPITTHATNLDSLPTKSAAGSIIKYFTKNTFWGFCASNFAFGFFLGNLPVGMAYIGDIESRKKKKDEMLGVLGTSIDLFVRNSLIRAIQSAALNVETLGEE
jgi:hypothetical protein